MNDQVPPSKPEDNEYYFALRSPTKLFEFEIESTLGHGGFGVTYRATDTLLQETVAIKEYLPNELAVRVSDSTVRAKSSADQKDFKDGLTAFLEEARMIARFHHPNIIQVRRFFELNGTGYIVLDYEHGQTLGQRVADGPVPEAELRVILSGILDGLQVVHDRAILHRDLKPSNIILREARRPGDYATPVLIDFGAARDFSGRHSRSVTAIAAPGYAPPEQYGIGGQQGPWTDFYAVGATAYRCATGTAPVDSLRRLRNDPLVPAAIAAQGKYDPGLLNVIDWMMRMDESQRPQSVASLREALKTGKVGDGEPSFTVTADGPGHAILEFDAKTNADILEAAFFIAPPGEYLDVSSGTKPVWSKQPHYFSLDHVGAPTGPARFRAGPDICGFIRAGARVTVSTSDNFIRASALWPDLPAPLPPPPPSASPSPRSRLWLIALLLLLLAGAGAVALNLETIADLACDKFGTFCSAQKLLFEEARTCIALKPACEASTCGADFRGRFPDSRLLPRLSQLERSAVVACEDLEKRAFDEANSCATQKETVAPCDVAACFRDYLAKYPNGRNVSAANDRVSRATAACQEAQERRVLNQSVQCARDTPCGADGCFAPYRSQFPTGTLRAQMETALRDAQQACPPTPPVPVPLPPVPTPPPTPSQILPDGFYNAVRGYNRPSGEACPGQVSFRVRIENRTIRFEGDETGRNGRFTRYWTGTIDQSTGQISILGSDASPSTIGRWSAGGYYGGATIDSANCGLGYFRINR